MMEIDLLTDTKGFITLKKIKHFYIRATDKLITIKGLIDLPADIIILCILVRFIFRH